MTAPSSDLTCPFCGDQHPVGNGACDGTDPSKCGKQMDPTDPMAMGDC